MGLVCPCVKPWELWVSMSQHGIGVSLCQTMSSVGLHGTAWTLQAPIPQPRVLYIPMSQPGLRVFPCYGLGSECHHVTAWHLWVFISQSRLCSPRSAPTELTPPFPSSHPAPSHVPTQGILIPSTTLSPWGCHSSTWGPPNRSSTIRMELCILPHPLTSTALQISGCLHTWPH